MPSSIGQNSARLRNIQAAQQRLGARISAARTKFASLERQKRLLQRRIDRAAGRLEKIAGLSVPTSVRRDVERQINSEGWMEKIIKGRFGSESEHGKGSKKWAKLMPGTVIERAKLGYGPRPVLQQTGVLMEGAIEAVAGTFKFAGVVWNVSDVNVEYAEYVQEGTEKMVARKFFDPPTEKEMKPVISRAIALIKKKLRDKAKGK